MIDEQSVPRELVALREQISRCVQRSMRAQQRLERAQEERDDATQAMERANDMFERWIAANPQPQIEMAV